MRKWSRCLAYVAVAYAAIAAISWPTVPWAVRRALKIVPQALPTFAASIERVAFNPLTLRLTMEGLSLTQERFGELASCRSVSVALSPTALLRLAVGLRELKIVDPRLTLSIGPDGSSILDVLPKKAPETTPAPAVSAKPTFIPRLVVGVLDVSGGELDFESRLRSAPQKLTAKPIEFRLENLSTIAGDNGVHRLKARTDKGESFDWQGRMTVRPPHLWGRVELGHVDLGRLSTGAPQLPVDVSAGRLDAATDYEVALASQTLTLALSDARAAITGLMWRLKAAKEGPRGPFALEIGPATLSVAAAVVPGGRITLDAMVPVAKTGQVRLKSYLTPKPLAGEAEVEVISLPLAPFSPLGPPPTQVSLDSGDLSASLQAALSGSDVDATLSFSLSDLKVSNRGTRRVLVRLGRLAVESAHLSTKARRLEVAAVRVEKPYLLLARGRDGKTNIESALGVSFASAAAPAPRRPRAAPKAASAQPPLRRHALGGAARTASRSPAGASWPRMRPWLRRSR